MLGVVLLCVAAPLQEGALYDQLYINGYHGDHNFSQATIIVDYLRRARTPGLTVLDYGCSHGWAVAQLWQLGINASGFDVSAVAASIADQTRSKGRRCVDKLGFCFTSTRTRLDVGGAKHAVDIVMSSDVLEHVPSERVTSVTRRLAHLARHQLVLKIASVTEGNRQPLRTLRARDRPVSLHVTVRPMRWWVGQFERVGFSLVSRLSPDTVVLKRY